jgi:flavin-dependent dehydrogenase
MAGSNTYDVVIVGGGLAGLATAILLARKSHSVLVLEKDHYPRHKVCGEYISMESWPFLVGLGLPLHEMELPRITKLHVSGARSSDVHAQLPQGGFGISRHLLDSSLAELAVAAGVTLLTKARVDNVSFADNEHTVFTNGGVYAARVVCGTWGKRSNIDVKWQRPFLKEKNDALSNYIGIKYHARYPWSQDTVALHNFAGGYCGVSPVEGNRTCVCYLTTAANLQRSGNDIQRLQQEVLMKNRHLSEILSDSQMLYESPLAISQISFERKELVYDHVMMLGDAAGMITPLCGNGMSMALHSGKVAAQQVADFLSGRIDRTAMEQQYVANWKQRFATRIRVGRMVQSMFGAEWRTAAFLRAAKAVPLVQRALIRSTSGQPF